MTARQPRSLRRRWTALLVAPVVLIAAPPHAAAQEAPSFTVSFDGLVPEIPMTRSASISIDESAWLRGSEWIERTGILVDAALTVRVCSPTGECVDASNPAASPRFPAGTLRVEVTATLPADASAGATGSAVGRLVFANDDVAPPGPGPTTTTVPGASTTTSVATGGSGGLVPTGSDAVTVVLWAVAALAVGTVLVVFTRRRSHGGVD